MLPESILQGIEGEAVQGQDGAAKEVLPPFT